MLAAWLATPHGGLMWLVLGDCPRVTMMDSELEEGRSGFRLETGWERCHGVSQLNLKIGEHHCILFLLFGGHSLHPILSFLSLIL